MKTQNLIVLVVSLAIIFVLVAWTGSQAAPTDPGVITVTGDAEVRVVPDEVILTLGVETWDKNLNTAKRQNDDRVKAVIALARGYGVEPRYIQTDHISIEPRYEDYYERERLIGYFVRKTIVITLKDLTKFEDLLTGTLEAGANFVHGIQFRTTELRQHRDQARALAIKAAQEKATALAGELGQHVGKPRNIHEEQNSWWSWYNSWWGSRWHGAAMAQNVIQEVGPDPAVFDDGLAPGQITVNARVSVTFELE
ncbi:MAG: SIMPL domain-containing protein [Anaerolineae bacterium]|nr:SIMPL domain-containing protein [Anaerolineae bacterium]